MFIDNSSTVFDVLAILCSAFTKEEEREYALKWVTATAKEIKMVINKYRNFESVILNSSSRQYIFNSDEINFLNQELDKIMNLDKQVKDELYLLAISIENKIDTYADWQLRGMIYRLEPLNANYKSQGISIYPYFLPQWDTSKSEKSRERNLNAKFQNYIMLRKEDESPYEIIMVTI